jgi:hypothetical protein
MLMMMRHLMRPSKIVVNRSLHLTISHRRRADSKPIFTEQRSEYSLVVTEPEATNCFSINSVLKNNIIIIIIKTLFKEG